MSRRKSKRKKNVPSLKEKSMIQAHYLDMFNHLQFIESQYDEFIYNFDDIYPIFMEDFDPGGFRSHVMALYHDLKLPVLRSLWLTHPNTFYPYIKNLGDEDKIRGALAAWADLISSPLDLSPDEFHSLNIHPLIFSNIKNYRAKTSEVIQKRANEQNRDDFHHMSRKYTEELVELVLGYWDNLVREKNLGSVNNLIFYILGIDTFSEILFDRVDINEMLIRDRLIQMEEFAESKRMKRVLALLQKILGP